MSKQTLTRALPLFTGVLFIALWYLANFLLSSERKFPRHNPISFWRRFMIRVRPCGAPP